MRLVLLAMIGSFLFLSPALAQQSTDLHPCGGPQQGQFQTPPDVPRTGSTTTIDLQVKQEGFLLCFVWQGVAQAPVIHARAGDHVVVNVTSQISDPCFINFYFGGGTCTPGPGPGPHAAPMAMDMNMKMSPGAGAAPHQKAYYPIEPNMAMPATGITNVHTHGLEVSPALHQDEVLKTAIVTPAMALDDQGSNHWSYDYAIPANQPPGLYWYHPHHHGETEAQDMMGLSGAIVIEDAEDDARVAAGIAAEVIVIKDIATNQAPTPPGAVAPPPAAPTPNRPTRAAAKHAAATRSPIASADPQIDEADAVACDPSVPPGLFTDLTVNGQFVPEGPANDATLPVVTMAPKEVRLIRLLNASADSYVLPNLYQLGGKGQRLPVAMKIVALDGVPLTNAAGNRTTRNESAPLNVPPGSRVEFLLTAPSGNSAIYLDSAAFNAGCTGNLTPERSILRFVTSGSPIEQNPAGWPSGPGYWLDHAGELPVAARRTFAFTEYPHSFTDPGSDTGATDFYITEIAGPDVTAGSVTIAPFNMDGPPNIVINLNGQPYRVEEWTIQNYTVEAHAFHIHQIHFREILGSSGALGPQLDVIHVPIAAVNPDGTPGKPGEVRLRLVFPASLKGTFVFHCHVLYHEDNGMMGSIEVKP